ncbi:MAG: ammonium transporter [Planctomycetia bacterium]|jgi:Amt family ammonium transporter|nr:ammonium transporter [Planctomycetia bacterium]
MFMADAATAVINGADTAWIIVATALVLFMTLPGLALFYGGLVRSKNVLSVFVQCFALTGVMTLLWVAYGYSLAFGNGGAQQWVIGNLDKAFFRGVTVAAVTGTIPEPLFAAFQMTFAIITPALIVGAFAERMRFKGMLLFSVLWFTLSYLPICHMAWAGEGSLFHGWGVLDFAGGTVVHVNAGIAGLVTCLMLGSRSGYPKQVMRPHNLPFAVMGAGMLWVGWFGFNAGSALAANGTAAMALLVTHIAAATATVVWMAIEMLAHGKASALGVATGAVAGLVAITPASGTAGPLGAVAIGAASAVAGYYFATSVKHRFGYDDSLDVFGVHGVGGVVGALLTGVFAATELGGSGLAEGMTIGSQVWAQAKSVLVTILWSGVVSAVAFFVADKLVGMRVPIEVERGGLDLAEHQEQAYEIV